MPCLLGLFFYPDERCAILETQELLEEEGAEGVALEQQQEPVSLVLPDQVDASAQSLPVMTAVAPINDTPVFRASVLLGGGGVL